MRAFEPWVSHEDRSVNHVAPAGDGGYWEARFVQRTDDYFICYVSSHSGCNQSCRFCHLTATGQTTMKPATVSDYLDQVAPVLATYRHRLAQGLPRATKMHYNFMARGEPLANPHFLNESQAVFDGMGQRAAALDLPAAFKVSSILPRTLEHDLTQVLADPRAELYYSLYSVRPQFRKRWLPKALPAEEGLDRVADYQKRTSRRVVLHWAFIAGENDSEADVAAVLDAIAARGLRAKFNLVRYNPHDARHGEESSQAVLDARFAQIQAALRELGGGEGSRQVPRVGFDVKASCGMFIEPSEGVS